jgi:hypothetical protein
MTSEHPVHGKRCGSDLQGSDGLARVLASEAHGIGSGKNRGVYVIGASMSAR